MKTLKEQIRDGEIGNLYLLTGNEPFLIRLNTDRIKDALISEEDAFMNFDHFVGARMDPEEIKISLETLPFLGERRVVVIEQSGAFGKKSNEFEGLQKILEDLPQTTTAVFMEDEIDKRTKLFKSVQKCGQVITLDHPNEHDLSVWIRQECKKRAVRIDNNEISYLLSLAGTDMAHILSEVEKLCSLVKEKGMITHADIDQIISPSVETRIFRLTDLLGSGQSAGAYLAYTDLLRQNEKKEHIFYMIGRQFHMLYRTSLMEKSSFQEVAAELKIRDFAAKEYIRQARMFGREKVYRILEKLYQTDLAVKTGEMTIDEALDLTLLTYADPASYPKNSMKT